MLIIYPADIFPDKDNVLHFSVMFIYEEYQQTDFIQDFRELDTFADHLAEMFPPGQYLEWDVEKKYKLNNLEIYLETNCSKPITNPRPNAPKERKLLKIRQNTTLRKVLQHEGYLFKFKNIFLYFLKQSFLLLHHRCIIPQIPVFYVVVADSPFKTQFIQNYFK